MFLLDDHPEMSFSRPEEEGRLQGIKKGMRGGEMGVVDEDCGHLNTV